MALSAYIIHRSNPIYRYFERSKPGSSITPIGPEYVTP
jgi:hypothetical protein